MTMRIEHRDMGDGVTHSDNKDCGCRPWRIVTDYWAKPIPMRQFDWQATTDDYDASWEGEETGYVSSHPIGHGPDEEAAIADLLEQLRERDDA